MATLTVPEKDKKALGELAAQSKDRIVALVEALRNEKPMLLMRQLAARVAPAAGMTEAEALKIIRLVATMSSVRTRENLTVDSFTDRVCALAFEKDPQRGEPLTPKVQAALKEYLRQLLSIRSLFVTGKALELTREHEHVMCEPRVVTDLRTIFGLDGKPDAAVAVHLLRISYHDGVVGNDRKQFTVAMDSEELRELKALLERAEEKEKSIKGIALQSQLLWLDPADTG